MSDLKDLGIRRIAREIDEYEHIYERTDRDA